MRNSWLAALCVLMAGFVLIASAADDLWYDAYESGLRAYQAGDLQTAETKFAAALKSQPLQGKHIKAYGTRFLRYFPEYYLGIIAVELGRYEEGRSRLEKLKASKLFVAADPEYAKLAASLRSAEDHLKPAAPPAAGAEPPDPAEEALRRSRALMDQGQYEEARSVLKKALQQDPSRQSILDLSAEIARRENEALEEGRREKARQQSGLLLSDAADALQRKDLAAARNLTSQAAMLGVDPSAVAEMERRIEAAAHETAAIPAAPPAKPPAAKPAEAAPAPARTQPDADELEALTAFYSGDYRRTIDLLQAVAAKHDSARLQFYLGCSHAALGLMQGNNGNAALDKARAHFTRSLNLDPSLRVDFRTISPRVLEIYRRAAKPEGGSR